MNCFASEEQLALYGSNDLSPKENAAISDHLLKCERCRETLADLQFSRQLVAEMSPQQPDDEELRLVRNAVMQRLDSYAKRNRLLQLTAIAAGLALVIGLQLNKPPRERRPAPVTILQTLPILPIPALGLPALVPNKAIQHGRHKQDTGAGLRAVALSTVPDGKYQLKMLTADPDVIILFQMDENTHAN